MATEPRLVGARTGDCAHIETKGGVLCQRGIAVTGEVEALPEGGLCQKCRRLGSISGALEAVGPVVLG